MSSFPIIIATIMSIRQKTCVLALVAIILLMSCPHISTTEVDVQSQSDTHELSHTISKRQATLQRFLVEPDNITVNIGESVVLPCRISNKAGIVQWTRDGFGLGTDPRLEGFPAYTMIHNDATGDYSLKISSVTLEDDATFQCQVGASDRVPGIRSQSARLTVQVMPEKPVIVHADVINAPASLQHRQVLLTTAGTKIELTCEAHGGRPAAKLAWLNGRNRVVSKGVHSTVSLMKDGKRYNTALKWVFEPTKADHNKRVTCRSSHTSGGGSGTNSPTNYANASILLEVKYAPEVKLEMTRLGTMSPRQSLVLLATSSANLHGRVGDSLKFKCSADGNPGKEALLYEWYQNDELIESDARDELLLQNIDKSLNGAEIVCKVSNKIGTGQASIRLNIAYGPGFSPSMEYVYGVAGGDNAHLKCLVDSNPGADITWIKIGSSSVMASGSKLSIKNVNPDNTGQYLCRASVKGFPEISAIVYLRIYGPPKIRKRKTHNYAIVGEKGHVECLVESVPSPLAITWIHNEKTLTSNSGNSMASGEYRISEETLEEEAITLRASFDIHHTDHSDYGRYNCVVVNKYGSDWHVVELDEQTSFITIATITSISISILVFIVLATIICLLSIKHQKLVAGQHDKKGDDTKTSYASSDDSCHNQNIYSTTTSTRTNSSSDKAAVAETGTIITRSGSTGSPRSSTSSFAPYSTSAGLSSSQQQQVSVSNDNNNYHNVHNLSRSQFALSQHDHHHPSLAYSHHPPPPSLGQQHPHLMHHHIGSPFVESMHHSAPFYNTLDMTSPDLMSHYQALKRLSMAEPLDSYGPMMSSSPSPYTLMPMYRFKDGPSPAESLYKANPYPVTSVVSSFRSGVISTLPTPLPSLAKELDDCLKKNTTNNSIATHV